MLDSLSFCSMHGAVGVESRTEAVRLHPENRFSIGNLFGVEDWFYHEDFTPFGTLWEGGETVSTSGL